MSRKIICFLDGNEKPYITMHETKPSEISLRVGLGHPNIGKISSSTSQRRKAPGSRDKPVLKVKIGIIGFKIPIKAPFYKLYDWPSRG